MQGSGAWVAAMDEHGGCTPVPQLLLPKTAPRSTPTAAAAGTAPAMPPARRVAQLAVPWAALARLAPHQRSRLLLRLGCRCRCASASAPRGPAGCWSTLLPDRQPWRRRVAACTSTMMKPRARSALMCRPAWLAAPTGCCSSDSEAGGPAGAQRPPVLEVHLLAQKTACRDMWQDTLMLLCRLRWVPCLALVPVRSADGRRTWMR